MTILVILSLATSVCSAQGVTDIGQTFFYAQTSWASVHRDGRNSDFVPFVAPHDHIVQWTALDGAATLLAPSVAPDGTLWITTGQGPGTSHLHRLDPVDGSILWSSPPQVTLDDLDSLALISAPLIDRNGHVYVSDINQFWSFKRDGTLRWTVDLTAFGATRGFISSILTKEGLVGGITADGLVLLFDRKTGRLAANILKLPGTDGPPGRSSPPGLWARGLVDPSLISDLYAGFFGESVKVANTPAVNPLSGFLYITAVGPTPNTPADGVLYGIRVAFDSRTKRAALSIAFETPIDGISGTSPAVSPDGTQVYAADSQGILSAFDGQTGEILWRQTGLPAPYSPGVGPDGTVYAGSGVGPDGRLRAFDPVDGSMKWSMTYDFVAAAKIGPNPPFPPFSTGVPTAKVSSVVTITATELWATLSLGYDLRLGGGVQVQLPHQTVLAVIDPEDGALIASTDLRDTVDGVVSVGPNGRLYVSHAAVLSSIFYFGFNSILRILAPDYVIDGPPLAGVTSVEPVSMVAHVVHGIEWVQALNRQALAALPDSNRDVAFTAVRRGWTQLVSLTDSILEARARNEIKARRAKLARQAVRRAKAHLGAARNILRQASQAPGQGGRAKRQVEQAQHALEQALEVLGG